MLVLFLRTTLLLLTCLCPLVQAADEVSLPGEFVFPLDDQHNHAPGIAELSDGSLIVSWYRGSGERTADDVAVWGARLPAGETKWSAPFLMVDTPGFPDCNTCLMVDEADRLWLFWPVIVANSWESAITHYLVADNPAGEGCPQWTRSGVILLKPDDFSAAAGEVLDATLQQLPRPLTDRESREVESIRERLSDKLYQRLGWQPRCKPTVLPSGRILLPLYSDTYSISIMAISDDQGATWRASQPLIGVGNIQPSVLRRDDGTLVALMRENGITGKLRISESADDGVTWSTVTSAPLPNPGSGVDALRLQSGRWIVVYNDTADKRNSLAIASSADEGRTWGKVVPVERHADGAYHYPAVIQSADGTIHLIYSYFVDGGKTMKHVALTEAMLD